VGLPELVIQLASLAVTEAVGDVNSQVGGGGRVVVVVCDWIKTGKL